MSAQRELLLHQQPFLKRSKSNKRLLRTHAETRQIIIDTVAQLPDAPSVQVLTGLTSIKLTNQALFYFTTANPTGIFGTADTPVHLDQLLLALQMSAPNKHQSDAIHRSINSKLAWIKSESLAQALTQGTDVLTQSSIEDPGSLKRPREATSLELVPIKETRITKFNLSTQAVPANRLPHQRPEKSTNFFGDLIQADSIQQLATSSLIGLHQQIPKPGSALSRARQSGLANSTRPGRSGADTRPGMVPSSQPTDFVVVPVTPKPATVSMAKVLTSYPSSTSCCQRQLSLQLLYLRV